MAYSRFIRNPFSVFGSYEPLVKVEEVKVEEVKVEEVKVEANVVGFHNLSPEEQDRAIQYFLDLKTPINGFLDDIRSVLIRRNPVFITFKSKEGRVNYEYEIDSQRKITILTVLPFMLKHLGIKSSFSVSYVFIQPEGWCVSLAPVIAPAP